MLRVECDCGNRAYIDTMGFNDDDDSLVVTWDIDTMGLNDDDNGISISCPQCGTVYSILRVQ